MEDYVVAEDLVRQQPLIHTRRLVNDGRCPEALAVISREIDAFPDWAEPWAVMAQAFSHMSRFSEALNAVDEALLRDPWHIQAQQLKAALLLQLGFKEQALEAAQRLVGLERSRPESHLFLSFAYAFMGMEIQAVEEARECRLAAPRRGLSNQALCVVHIAAKRWAQAEHHALQALQMEGPIASIYHDLGVALEQQGKSDAARNAFTIAAGLDPRFSVSLRSFNRRRLIPTRGIPALVVVAAVMLLLPMNLVSVVLASIAAIGSVVLLIRTMRGHEVSFRDLIRAH
jgi:tetratricopeptide (TPR) repeat protein